MKPRNYVAKAQQSGAGKHANKKYRGVVVFKYYQTVEVEAESEDKARELMYDEFHMNKCTDQDSEIYDFWEVV